jgi:hypothetical protein
MVNKGELTGRRGSRKDFVEGVGSSRKNFTEVVGSLENILLRDMK